MSKADWILPAINVHHKIIPKHHCADFLDSLIFVHKPRPMCQLQQGSHLNSCDHIRNFPNVSSIVYNTFLYVVYNTGPMALLGQQDGL